MTKKIFLITLLLLTFFILLIFPQEEKEVASSLFEQPLLITSAGQTADYMLASVLAKRGGLNFILSKTATPRDLGNIKTLGLVLGVSMKGLGAAGLDMTKERKRVNLLVAEAQRKNIPLLCLHLGGEARRGQLSDALISAFLPKAKMAIVVKSGNKDKLFTRICEEYKIPLVEVEKTVDILKPLKESFK